MMKKSLRAVVLGTSLLSMSCWALTPPEAMNMAGLQRTLGQRIAKDYLMLGSDVRVEVATKQLEETLAQFESSHEALTAFAPTPEIAAALADVGQTWDEYKVLATQTPDKADAPRMLAVSERLLGQCQHVTDLFEAHNGGGASHLVNRSGWLRVLSQRIASLYLAQSWDVQAEGIDAKLNKAVNEFGAVLEELHAEGGTDPDVVESLRKANAQWKFTQAGIDLNTPANAVPTAVVTSTDSLFKKMNELTRLYAGLSMN